MFQVLLSDSSPVFSWSLSLTQVECSPLLRVPDWKRWDAVLCVGTGQLKWKPKVLYVDRDCCGPQLVRSSTDGMTFRCAWTSGMAFSQRMHQLYGVSRVLTCIFECDAEDTAKLCQAKAVEENCDESAARRLLSRRELALHCCRRTCGAETTTELIDQLIKSLRGDKGHDTLGMTIFDQPLMDKIWSEEKKHISCIQDPASIQLFVQTGTRRRGGVKLKTYCCAHGSVSLESFHLHITRFIPG